MAGYHDVRTAHVFTDAAQVASDLKEDQSGFLSWASIVNVGAIVLVITLAILLTLELAWWERRRRTRDEQAEPTSTPDPHKGET